MCSCHLFSLFGSKKRLPGQQTLAGFADLAVKPADDLFALLGIHTRAQIRVIQQLQQQLIDVGQLLGLGKFPIDNAVRAKVGVLHRAKTVIDLLQDHGVAQILIHIRADADGGIIDPVFQIPEGDTPVHSLEVRSHPLHHFLPGAEVDLQIHRLGILAFIDTGEAPDGIEPPGKVLQDRKILPGGIAVDLITDGRCPLLQEGGIAAVDKLRIQADLVKIQDTNWKLLPVYHPVQE